MVRDRSRYGLLVSALGAVVLAISVFLPWYGVSFTARGIAAIQQLGGEVARQIGDPALQSRVAAGSRALTPFAGTEVASLNAHQVLHDLNVILLILAGLALLDALIPLARAAAAVPEGAGGAVVLLGLIAAVCVLFRIAVPPTPAGGMIALSAREGAWLALAGSIAMIVGGLWPRRVSPAASLQAPVETPAESSVEHALAGLSGWTPGV
jgi:hypothetical protein